MYVPSGVFSHPKPPGWDPGKPWTLDHPVGRFSLSCAWSWTSFIVWKLLALASLSILVEDTLKVYLWWKWLDKIQWFGVCIYIYRKINILYSINDIFIWFNLIYIHYMICWLKIWRFPAYIHVSFLGKEQGGGVNEKANKRLVDIARLMQLEEQAPTAKTTMGNYWQILTQ